MKGDNFIEFDNLDPAVSSIVRGSRASRAGQTQKQRKQAAKDRARNRRMVDIDPAIERELEQAASLLGVPFSSLINFLLASALPVDMEKCQAARVITRSMRYEYVLKISATTKGNHKGVP